MKEFNIRGVANPRASVILADDHPVVAESLSLLLDPRFRIARIVHSGQELIEAATRDAPDVIVSDLGLGDMTGLDVLDELQSGGVGCPMVIISGHAEPEIAQSAIRRGALGYVVKSASSDDLVTAVEHAIAGFTWISPAVRTSSSPLSNPLEHVTNRQHTILKMLALGLRAKQIGYHLGISTRTVEAHKYTVMQIFGVSTTVDLVRLARRLGLVDLRASAESPAHAKGRDADPS